MISIIRALSHVRKLKKEAKEANKKKRPKKPFKKMREKERRGNVTIIFLHLRFEVAP